MAAVFKVSWYLNENAARHPGVAMQAGCEAGRGAGELLDFPCTA
jgi:hypothetical protein